MITNEQFSDLFLEDEEKKNRVLFNDPGVIGFSVTKPYPHEGLMFKPLSNQKGEDDTVALIKIYFKASGDGDSQKRQLNVFVSPVSKYLLDGVFFYDYSDPRSPIEASVKEWEKALKPVELIDRDCVFDISTNVIFDEDLQQPIEPKELLSRIFGLHIKTVRKFSGLPFRLKLNSKNFISEKIIYLSKSLIFVNKYIFSRDYPRNERSLDHIAYELFLKPIPHRTYSIFQPKNLSVFGTELPVSKHSVVISPFVFLSAYTVVYFWLPNLKQALDNFVGNAFVATSIVIVWFVLFDTALPHLLLTISNIIVRSADRLRRINIRLK